MLDFLKKLFGLKKQEESVSMPKEYIIPKKQKPVEEPIVEEATTLIFNVPDQKSEFSQQEFTTEKPVYSIEQEWTTFRENGKYGYEDESGNKVIAAKFDSAGDFINGYAMVTSKECRGLINTRGEFILKPEYTYIDDEKEGLLRLEKDNRYGFANTNGKVVIPVEYLDTGEFSEGLVWVEKNDALVGFIDKDNRTVIDFTFDYCGDFSEGLASATKYAQEEGQQDIYGFIDRTGKFVIIMDYDEAGDFKEGLAPVCIDGKFTFIDKKGKQICTPTYNAAGDFVAGLSCVQLESGGKWGYADKTGKLVIPYQYDDTSDYMDDDEMLEFVNAQKLKYLK